MQRRYGPFRAIVVFACAALIAAFATIQAASFALEGSAAVAGAVPRLVPERFGLAVYGFLDRVAPAPYVESTLAANALARGDAGAAERYALRLPGSPARDELLARIALARNDDALALEYFLAAPDVDAVQTRVRILSVHDAAAAYALERELKLRLALARTHPDAVAEASFRMGELANLQARSMRSPQARGAWFDRGMDDLQSAVDLAPLSEKYVIAAANQALLVGRIDRAGGLFVQAVDVDPASADAIAGEGAVALVSGDVATARRDLERARAIDPQSGMVLALERWLRAGKVIVR